MGAGYSSDEKTLAGAALRAIAHYVAYYVTHDAARNRAVLLIELAVAAAVVPCSQPGSTAWSNCLAARRRWRARIATLFTGTE